MASQRARKVPEVTSSCSSFPGSANPQLDRLYPFAKDGQRQFYCADCLLLRTNTSIERGQEIWAMNFSKTCPALNPLLPNTTQTAIADRLPSIAPNTHRASQRARKAPCQPTETSSPKTLFWGKSIEHQQPRTKNQEPVITPNCLRAFRRCRSATRVASLAPTLAAVRGPSAVSGSEHG